MDECAEEALASPMPDPSIAFEGVFADAWEPLGDGEAPWSLELEAPTTPQWQRPSAPNGHGRASLVEHGRAA